jgi:hypothetical protein
MKRKQSAPMREEPNPEYRDNIFIQELPPLVDTDGALDALVSAPKMSDAEFRKLPLYLRLERLEKLQEIFVPLDFHAQAFTRLLRLIRWSYGYRNPTNPAIMKFIYDMAINGPEKGMSRESVGGGGSIGLTITGVTGAGKTSFLDRFIGHLKRGVVIHKKIGGRRCRQPQILYLRVQCPEKASLMALGQAVIREIDRKLGTNHSLGAKRLSQSNLLLRVTSLCTSYFVGVLIVDDVQNLPQGHIETQAMLNFFCNFMEDTGIPLVLSGTLRLLSLLADTKSLSKLTAKGLETFPRLRADSDDWAMLVEALWSYSVTALPMPMPLELPKMLYFHSQGVPRILRETMCVIHLRMADGTQSLTQELLDDIAGTEMLKYQEALSVLRRHAWGILPAEEAAQYEDLLPSPKSAKVLKADILKREAEGRKASASVAPDEGPSPTRDAVSKPESIYMAAVKGKKAQPKVTGAKRTLESKVAKAVSPYDEVKAMGWVGKPPSDFG